MPEDLRQIQWTEYGETVLHPLALLLTLLMIIVILKGDQRKIFIPFLIVGTFMTAMQRIVVFSFDFTMIRLLLISVYFRFFLRNDGHHFSWSKMDTLVVLYVFFASITYIVLWGNASAIINRLGFSFDVVLVYFGVRIYLKSLIQLNNFIRAICIVLFIVAIAMMVEQLTQYNFFSIFGGVRPITVIREGRLRSQGAFSHPILAGTFGAVFLPLAWSLRNTMLLADRRLSNIGLAGSSLMVYASSSSGPVISLFAALFGIYMFKFRQHIGFLVLFFVFLLIGLHIYMDSPVWHLISRIDIVGGSTGYHRFALIDRTIENFREWALVGVYTTGHWGWGLNDVTNMFVLQAVRGGVITLILFILIIREGFLSVSKSICITSADMKRKISWAWGVVLFSHTVSFFGVSYFGQMDFFWYLTLGILASLPQVFENEESTGSVEEAVYI